MSLTSEINASILATQLGSNDLATPSFKPRLQTTIPLGNGTGANQADRLFTDTRTIAASGSETLDLAGSLTDVFGATITMVEVVAIMITASSSNTNNVVVGGGSNAVPLFGDVSDTIAVKPGGVFQIGAPGAAGQFTVTAGTGDLLQIANSSSGSSVTYTIMIIGRSA